MTKKEKKSNIMEYVIYAVVGAGIALVFNIFFGVVMVQGHSMDSTLHDRQLLIMQKKFVEYRVGDIVVANIVRFDTEEEETIIKRVIATEGQTVKITDGKVIVDGKELQENYIKEEMYKQTYEEITVPEGEVYVMGDNRNNSLDSRVQGTIKLQDIQGRILFK